MSDAVVVLAGAFTAGRFVPPQPLHPCLDGAGLAGRCGTGTVGRCGTGTVGRCGTGTVGRCGAGFVGRCGAGFVGRCGAGLVERHDLLSEPTTYRFNEGTKRCATPPGDIIPRMPTADRGGIYIQPTLYTETNVGGCFNRMDPGPYEYARVTYATMFIGFPRYFPSIADVTKAS